MKTLPDLLNLVVTTLQASPLCRVVNIAETRHFSRQQFSLKVRAELASGGIVQVHLYCNGEHTDCAYQLVRDEKPILRWDNAEHFPSVLSHPHHFHAATGEVQSSTLNGDPGQDLPLVLTYLATPLQ